MNKKILLAIVFAVFIVLIVAVFLWQFDKLPIKKETSQVYHQQPAEVLYQCPLNTDDITGVMQWEDGWPLSEYKQETHLQDSLEDVDIAAYYGSQVVSPTDGEVISVEEGKKIQTKVKDDKSNSDDGDDKKAEDKDKGKAEEKCGEKGKWTGGCTQIDKKPFIATTSGNLIISKVQIKAKNKYFEDDNNGCFKIEGLNTSTVKVDKVGEDSEDCQQIAHVKFIISADTASPSPEVSDDSSKKDQQKTTHEAFYFVIIKGSDNYFYELGHLENVMVKAGDKVTKGQQIGNLITSEKSRQDNKICKLDKDETNKNCYKIYLHFLRFTGSPEEPLEQSALSFLSDYCQLMKPSSKNLEFPVLPTLNCVKVTNNPNIQKCFMEKPLPSPSPSSSLPVGESPSPAPSGNGSPLPSLSPPASHSPSPAPSLGPNQISIEFKIKFSGVPANSNNINLQDIHKQKDVRVVFQNQKGENIFNEQNEGWQTFQYNPDIQSYTSIIVYSTDDLAFGNYKILLKGLSHRQMKFCKPNQQKEETCPANKFININSDSNIYNFDFSLNPLEFGDINQDGVVNVQDYSLSLGCVKADSRIGSDKYEKECNKTDANFDGVVDSTDIDLLYKTLSVQEDEV